MSETTTAWVEPIHPDDASRFGDWVHDNVLQVLEYIASGGFGRCTTYEELRHVAEEAVSCVRASLDGLLAVERPNDVRERLEVELDRVRGLCDTDVHIRHFEDVSDLDSVSTDCLVAGTREALMNVCRHANARIATVDVQRMHDVVCVTVTDDGVGFDPLVTDLGHGLGNGVHRRLRDAGGAASVTSSPGRGTSVTLAVPVMDADGRTA